MPSLQVWSGRFSQPPGLSNQDPGGEADKRALKDKFQPPDHRLNYFSHTLGWPAAQGHREWPHWSPQLRLGEEGNNRSGGLGRPLPQSMGPVAAEGGGACCSPPFLSAASSWFGGFLPSSSAWLKRKLFSQEAFGKVLSGAGTHIFLGLGGFLGLGSADSADWESPHLSWEGSRECKH